MSVVTIVLYIPYHRHTDFKDLFSTNVDLGVCRTLFLVSLRIPSNNQCWFRIGTVRRLEKTMNLAQNW